MLILPHEYCLQGCGIRWSFLRWVRSCPLGFAFQDVIEGRSWFTAGYAGTDGLDCRGRQLGEMLFSFDEDRSSACEDRGNTDRASTGERIEHLTVGRYESPDELHQQGDRFRRRMAGGVSDLWN